MLQTIDEETGGRNPTSKPEPRCTIFLKYAWRHSHLRGALGADTWIGFGILTYNLDRTVVISAT